MYCGRNSDVVENAVFEQRWHLIESLLFEKTRELFNKLAIKKIWYIVSIEINYFLTNISNLSYAFRHLKRGSRVHNVKVIVQQPLMLSAASFLQHVILYRYTSAHFWSIAISEFWKQILHVLVKRIFRITCAKNCKIAFRFVKIMQVKLYVFFWTRWQLNLLFWLVFLRFYVLLILYFCPVVSRPAILTVRHFYVRHFQSIQHISRLHYMSGQRLYDLRRRRRRLCDYATRSLCLSVGWIMQKNYDISRWNFVQGWAMNNTFYAPQQVPAGTALRRVLAMVILSVCLSVRPSVTTRWYTKLRWDRDSGSSPYGSLEYLVSCEVIWCQWVKRFP